MRRLLDDRRLDGPKREAGGFRPGGIFQARKGAIPVTRPSIPSIQYSLYRLILKED